MVVEADHSPSVACSIGVAHQSRPVVGVIALPFLNQIVRHLITTCYEGTTDIQYSAYEGGGAFMNRATPLPLTGGVPQPLTDLSDCIISAECTSRPLIQANVQGVQIGQSTPSSTKATPSSSLLVILVKVYPAVEWLMPSGVGRFGFTETITDVQQPEARLVI